MMTKAVDTSAGGGKRLQPAFVADWVVAAAHHGVREAWIARQPILWLSECNLALRPCSATKVSGCQGIPV